jgi:hypothetical protein
VTDDYIAGAPEKLRKQQMAEEMEKFCEPECSDEEMRLKLLIILRISCN